VITHFKFIAMTRKIFYFSSSLLLVFVLGMTGCKKKEYALPTAKNELQNDVIKRTLGPNIVGEQIEFAYAMALPSSKGKLVSAEVTASIPGASSTYLENRSFNTNGSGVDVGITVGTPSVNNGGKTTVTFNKDTMAATLRYYYVIPEEARGKTVSFTFTAKSNDGETVSYNMGPYTIAKMAMVRNLTVKNGDSCYISLADMSILTAAQATATPDKVDLVYLFRSFTSAFNYALVAPASDTSYHPGLVFPAAMNRNTKIRKVFNLQDYNLARLQYGIYIDDVDFQQLDLTDAPNFAVNLKAEAGVWAETADKKYRAYVYINSVNATTRSAVISIKRYTL
jgi:hypothetical protein